MDYDKIAHLYTSEKRTFHPTRIKAYQEWIDECNSKSWTLAIDLGCGEGQSTRLLVGKNRNIQGIDRSEKMLELAIKKESENALGINYFQSDIFQKKTCFEVAKDKVNLVTSFAVFHYAKNQNELSNLFENINDVITSGGRVVAVILKPNVIARSFVPGSNTASIKWLGFPYQNGSKVEVTLFGTDNQKICALENYNWHRKTYEKIMKKFGFREIEWKSPKNIDKMGLILLTAKKR